MEITRGKIESAVKVIIYGPEGIGKSTFASRFPDPLFIDTEGSTKCLDVARLPAPDSWEMLFEEVEYVKTNPHICRTLVIDTADWSEWLCISSICASHKKKSIESFDYGKGYTILSEEFARLLHLLEDVIERGVNVVLTAHAKMRKFDQPDAMGGYDRWEMKLTRQVAPLCKEWADIILFANYEIYTVTEEKSKKAKAMGGERVMYTTHHPCWDAKNRHNLAEKLPFTYDAIAHIFTSAQKPVAATQTPAEEPTANASAKARNIPDALWQLMQANDITEEELREVVAQKGHFPLDMPVSDYPSDYVEGCLIACFDKVREAVFCNRDLPFDM